MKHIPWFKLINTWIFQHAGYWMMFVEILGSRTGLVENTCSVDRSDAILYLKRKMFITLWKEPPMHPLQLALNRMSDAGLPGAFVYIEDPDGPSQFYTAGVADLSSRQRMTQESWYRSRAAATGRGSEVGPL